MLPTNSWTVVRSWTDGLWSNTWRAQDIPCQEAVYVNVYFDVSAMYLELFDVIWKLSGIVSGTALDSWGLISSCTHICDAMVSELASSKSHATSVLCCLPNFLRKKWQIIRSWNTFGPKMWVGWAWADHFWAFAPFENTRWKYVSFIHFLQIFQNLFFLLVWSIRHKIHASNQSAYTILMSYGRFMDAIWGGGTISRVVEWTKFFVAPS